MSVHIDQLFFNQISGESSESQVLTAAVMYQQRPILLTKVLNDLYHLLRFESCTSIHQALDVVLTAMEKHLNVKHMQISGRYTRYLDIRFNIICICMYYVHITQNVIGFVSDFV